MINPHQPQHPVPPPKPPRRPRGLLNAAWITNALVMPLVAVVLIALFFVVMAAIGGGGSWTEFLVVVLVCAVIGLVLTIVGIITAVAAHLRNRDRIGEVTGLYILVGLNIGIVGYLVMMLLL